MQDNIPFGIPVISQQDILNGLLKAGVKQGETLLIHSFLGAFGTIQGGMESVVAAFKSAVGGTGTLMFPTYNYDFCKGAIYNHEETPSQVGQLTEFVRSRSEAERVFHPVYSHAVMGAKRQYYCQQPGTSGFGKGSSFARLRPDEGASLLFFGVNWNSATFIHHVEETLNVPYRFVKLFSGEVIHQGKKSFYTAEIFSRYLELNIAINLKPFQQFMLEKGKNTQVTLGRGIISKVKVSDFFDHAVAQYRKNPFYFLAAPLDLSKIERNKHG